MTAQWVKAHAAKTQKLSSTPHPHQRGRWKDRTDTCKLSLDLYVYTVDHVTPPHQVYKRVSGSFLSELSTLSQTCPFSKGSILTKASSAARPNQETIPLLFFFFLPYFLPTFYLTRPDYSP